MKQDFSEKILKYTAVFEPAEEGGYVVSVPALPGCHTQGETIEEAKSMAKDAIGGYLAVLKEQGWEIPKESGKAVISEITVENPATYI